MSYSEVMGMPLKAFWSFTGSVARLSAEQDIRRMQVTAAVQSSEGFEQIANALKIEMGTPSVVIDDRSDPQANAKLRRILTG